MGSTITVVKKPFHIVHLVLTYAATIDFNQPMHEGFEASLSQRGLLTASLRSNNSVPYLTKDNHTHNQEVFLSSSVRSNTSVPHFTKDNYTQNQEVFTSSVRSNASSVPYFTKEPIIAHEPYDLLMPYNSQSSLSSLMTSNEVRVFI